jgi:hypothetical protein
MSAQIGAGSGSPPTIQYLWVLPDEDSTEAGTQVNIIPSNTRNDIYACIVVSDPQGRDDIKNVWVDVEHPDCTRDSSCGEFKYQVHAEKLDIEEDYQEIEQCKADAVEAGLITQQDADLIDYQIFDQPAWYMYKVYLPMEYHQPTGWYHAEGFASDTIGQVSYRKDAYYEWVAATYLELDFTNLDFGVLQPSVYAVIQGDTDMSTSNAPTVKNEGNTLIDVDLKASNLEGEVLHKIIDDFDAKFLGEQVYFSANNLQEFGNDLGLCRTEKIDFSVHAEVGTPVDDYSGTMTIYATGELP